MNNESLTFVENTLKDSELIIEDIQNYIKNKKAANNKTYMILTIFSDYLQTNKVEDLISVISPYVMNENSMVVFKQLLAENEDFIKNLLSDFNRQKFENNKLLDIEWKFVAKASLEMAEVGAYEPSIELKLIFSNGKSEILETDFSTFKKLQEDLEIASSSFQTSYAKKVIAFSK
jgi:hypothetical protein